MLSLRKEFELVKSKKEKSIVVPSPGKTPPKVAIDSLQDAVVEGKLTVDPGAEILVVKRADGKESVATLCTVMKVEGDLVSTWDETQSKWYCFSASNVGDHVVAIKRLK